MVNFVANISIIDSDQHRTPVIRQVLVKSYELFCPFDKSTSLNLTAYSMSMETYRKDDTTISTVFVSWLSSTEFAMSISISSEFVYMTLFKRIKEPRFDVIRICFHVMTFTMSNHRARWRRLRKQSFSFLVIYDSIVNISNLISPRPNYSLARIPDFHERSTVALVCKLWRFCILFRQENVSKLIDPLCIDAITAECCARSRVVHIQYTV